jgi:hypothetical protein
MRQNIKHEIIHIETEKNDIDVHIDNVQKTTDDSILQVPHIEKNS